MVARGIKTKILLFVVRYSDKANMIVAAIMTATESIVLIFGFAEFAGVSDLLYARFS